MANQGRSFSDAAGGTQAYDCSKIISTLERHNAPQDTPDYVAGALEAFWGRHPDVTPQMLQNLELTVGGVVASGNIGNRSGT